jgi:hypothetical protein
MRPAASAAKNVALTHNLSTVLAISGVSFTGADRRMTSPCLPALAAPAAPDKSAVMGNIR